MEWLIMLERHGDRAQIKLPLHPFEELRGKVAEQYGVMWKIISAVQVPARSEEEVQF